MLMPLIPMLLVLWFLCPKTISRKRTKTEVLAMRDHPFQRLKTRFEPQRHLKPHCVPRSRTPLTSVCCSAPQIGQNDGLLIFCGFPVFLRIAPQIKPSDPSKTSFAIDFHDERVRVIRPAPEVIRDLNWDRKLDLIEVNGVVFTMRVGRGKAVQILCLSRTMQVLFKRFQAGLGRSRRSRYDRRTSEQGARVRCGRAL